MSNTDSKHHTNEMIKLFPVVRDLDSTRFYVLANMASSLGVAQLAGFEKMWAALERNDFQDAANEILDSQWGREYNGRAVEYAQLMKTGT